MSSVSGTSDGPGVPGVRGDGKADNDGVVGHGRRGVVGESETFQGVFGKSRDNAGVVGESDRLHGVFGICHNPNGGGIFGHNDAGGFAAVFDGRVAITGHINCDSDLAIAGDVQLLGADVAEQFQVTGDRSPKPGSVMVLSGVDSIAVSSTPYDQRVAGIVSGAGNYRPGIVLDRQSAEGRSPLALSGKVWCLVDAGEGAIGLGDLLTTSATPGHAMRATDRARAFGAVVGKALGSLQSGRGLVPVFIALQ
jgi:hypothetical protein